MAHLDHCLARGGGGDAEERVDFSALLRAKVSFSALLETKQLEKLTGKWAQPESHAHNS